jgi:hypothetical protein
MNISELKGTLALENVRPDVVYFGAACQSGLINGPSRTIVKFGKSTISSVEKNMANAGSQMKLPLVTTFGIRFGETRPPVWERRTEGSL